MTDREALRFIGGINKRLSKYAVKDLMEQMDSENRLSYRSLCRTKRFIRAWLKDYMAYWEDHVSRHEEYLDATDYLNKQAIGWRRWWVKELKTQWHWGVAERRVERYI